MEGHVQLNAVKTLTSTLTAVVVLTGKHTLTHISDILSVQQVYIVK